MARSYLDPLTEAQLNALVNRYVSASLGPQRRQVADQRRRAIGLAKGLAELQRGIGPATNQAYQAAATTQGGLAQGFTGAMRESASADAQAAQEILSRLNAPQAQIQQVQNVGQGAADQAYALGGYIPGQSLAREGAAAAAAQNQLPATTLGRGQQELVMLEKALREIEAQAPKVRMDFLQQLLQNEQSKAATRIQGEYLGLAGDKFGLETRATVADITGVDPVTGLPTVDTQGKITDDANKRREARRAAIKAREDAFRSARQDALDLARTLSKGEEIDNPALLDPNAWKKAPPPEKIVDRPTREQARQQLWAEIGPDLMRFAAGASGKRALKRRVFSMIDQALTAAGYPKTKKSKPKSPNVYRKPGDRPG